MSDVTEGVVTVLFTDVEGSTALHAAKGDAAARAVLTACEELVRGDVEKHGGRVIKSLGDGLMVAFGSPRRAVTCALAIQDALERQRRRGLQDSVRLRCGLHTGEVADVGGDLLGAAVNAAARICAKAQGGEVLVSEVVRQLCGTVPDTVFRERGRMALKGFPERWRLHQVTSTRAPTLSAAVGEETPFVGRDVERAELGAKLERALAGQGGLVLIGGEPGVGKTRLGEEVAAEGRRRGYRVFTGHCYQRGGDLPYMPWVEIVEQAAAQTSPEVLLEALGESASELARIVPQLRRLFPDIPPPLEMPPEQQRRYALLSIAEYVTRVASRRPQLYILEDLHWADEATLLFLEYLAERLPSIPVLVLGTYRDPPIDISRTLEETLAGLVRRRQARLLSLKRHPRSEVEIMLRGLSGQPPPEPVVTAIYGETEGNALFVEEVFRHLTETGALLDDNGRFRDDLHIDELDVPENVRLVTAHRFDRLSESTRRMLMLASVVGRRFSFDLLAAMGELEEGALLDAIDEAERARLIVADPTLAGSFWFSHELMRQTMLTRLSTPRRQRHHLRVADALERVHKGDVERHAAEVGQHLIEAGAAADPVRTVRYLSIAAAQATAATAFEQALQHLEAAVALAGAVEPTARAELMFHFGMAQRSVGRWDEALVAWRSSLDGFETLGDTGAVGRVCVEAGYNLVWAARWGEGLELFQRGLAALGEEPSADRARLLAKASVPVSYGGEFTMGDAMLEEALRLAANLGDDTLKGFVLNEMCAARQASMRVSDVVSSGQQAAAFLRAAGQLWPAATALGFVALNLVQLGRFEESASVAAEVAPLADRIGNYPALYLHGRAEGTRKFFSLADLDQLEAFGRWDLEFGQRTGLAWTGHSYAWLGYAEFLRGKWEPALDLLERGATSAPAGALGGFCWAPLFHCHVYLGHRAQALAQFEEKRSELPQSGKPSPWGWWAQLMAFTEGLYVLGQREEAAAFHPALVEARSTGAITTSYIEGRLLERIAGISAAAGGQWDVAEEHFRTALRQADELPHRLEQLETRRFYARMLADRGRPADRERATDLLGEAITGYTALGMPRHARLAHDALTDPTG